MSTLLGMQKDLAERGWFVGGFLRLYLDLLVFAGPTVIICFMGGLLIRIWFTCAT